MVTENGHYDYEIKNGKVTALGFEYAGKRYTTTITPSEITVSKPLGLGVDIIGTYHRQESKMFWFIHHVCGLRGFGHQEDSCRACESNTSLTENYSEAHSHADSTLPEALVKVNDYCGQLEKLLETNGF